jgi:hypothetical protein
MKKETFGSLVVETLRPLTEKIRRHFLGIEKIRNAPSFIRGTLGSHFKMSSSFRDLFWVKGQGYIEKSDWKALVGEKVLSCKQSVTSRAEEIGYTPSGLWQQLNRNQEFVEFSKSFEYMATPRQSEIKIEKRIESFLKSFNFDVSLHPRLFKKEGSHHKFELDLYLPDRGIAFEFNGYYWHSAINEKYKEYHKNKTEICLENGVKLYHLWEAPEEKILGFVKQKLGLCKKVHARKTEVRKLPVGEANTLLNEWHMDEGTQASFAYSLFMGEEPLSVMTFRGHKEGIEIARFATKTKFSVTGGFSKLLSHAIPELKAEGYSVLISYCNRDLTPDWKDSVYHKQGFEFLGDTGSSLKYYCDKSQNTLVCNHVYSRQVFQKHKLKEIFPEYNGENVRSFLESKLIYEVWNSGNWKFRRELSCL